jgi:hypothetical protein
MRPAHLKLHYNIDPKGEKILDVKNTFIFLKGRKNVKVVTVLN